MKKKLIIVIGILIVIASFVVADLERRQRTVAEKLFKEGVYHFNQQEYTAARNSFVRALSSDPNYYKARYWLGRAYYHSGHVKSAIAEWEHVLNLVGDDPLLKNKINRLLYQIVPSKEDSSESFIPTKGLIDPRSREIVNPTSIYIDQNRLFWVAGYASNNVVIYDRNGQVVDRLTSGDVGFNHPFDIIKNSKEEIYISDYGNDRIHKYSRNRDYLLSFGHSGLGNGEFYGPQGLAIDQYDQVYVVDNGNRRVQKFDSNGQFLMSLGQDGRKDGKLLNPVDVVVLKNQSYQTDRGMERSGDLIYVTDTGKKRIQIYESNGNYLKSLGEDILVEPKGIKRVSDHEILVSDAQKGIIKIVLNPLEIEILEKVVVRLESDIPEAPIANEPYVHKFISAGLASRLRKNEELESKYPVDMALDANQFLYTVDFKGRDVSILVPEKMKYNNLDVSILQSFVAKYSDDHFVRRVINYIKSDEKSLATVTHRVKVRDQSGKPIYGLKSPNFRVIENGVIHDVSSIVESPKKQNLSLAILNERSMAMTSHKNRLEEISTKLLEALNPEDQVEVINFNKEHWVAQSFIKNNLLSPRTAILEKKFPEALLKGKSDWEIDEIKKDDIKLVGKAFFDGVTDAFSAVGTKGAIILITSGELKGGTGVEEEERVSENDEENSESRKSEADELEKTARKQEKQWGAFYPYGYDVCLNYAKNNQVPVYVISFSDGPITDELKDLATRTGGHYFRAFQDNDLKDLIDMIRNYQKGDYFIRYESKIPAHKSFKWRDVQVKVKLKDLFGQDRAGYFTR